jgi:hypothetical protein
MWRTMRSARDQFVEQVGLMAQAEGVPRIAGQILGYLIVEGAPRTLSQMTEAVKISKGSASTNARLLENMGAVRRVSALGQRQDAYEAVEEPGLQTLAGMAERFRAGAAAIEAISAGFSDDDSEARARVARFAEFHRESAAFLDEWRARMSAQCGQNSDTESEE